MSSEFEQQDELQQLMLEAKLKISESVEFIARIKTSIAGTDEIVMASIAQLRKCKDFGNLRGI